MPDDIVTYRNGNYRVFLDRRDGTKVRMSRDDDFLPEFPESMDVKITDRCDVGCPFCHEDSRPDGLHADLDQPFLDTLHPYSEIAVGGGNVLSHPGLDGFLERLRDLRCVPSITVNQLHFESDFDRILDLYESGLVYGVGVSLVTPSRELFEKLRRIPTSVVHTINGILTESDVRAMSGQELRVLVLGYKNLRRGHDWKIARGSEIESNMDWLAGNLQTLFDATDTAVFDNLALDQLPVRETIGEDLWSVIYGGDEGSHTYYIDMVRREYAVSSTSADRFPIGNLTVPEMFRNVREIARGERAA